MGKSDRPDKFDQVIWDLYEKPKLKFYEYLIPFVTGIALLSTMQFWVAMVCTLAFVGIAEYLTSPKKQ